MWSLVDGSLLSEITGPGDTFDVSWNCEGTLLSACFSSGNVIVQDSSSFLLPSPSSAALKHHTPAVATTNTSTKVITATVAATATNNTNAHTTSAVHTTTTTAVHTATAAAPTAAGVMSEDADYEENDTTMGDMTLGYSTVVDAGSGSGVDGEEEQISVDDTEAAVAETEAHITHHPHPTHQPTTALAMQVEEGYEPDDTGHSPPVPPTHPPLTSSAQHQSAEDTIIIPAVTPSVTQHTTTASSSAGS